MLDFKQQENINKIWDKEWLKGEYTQKVLFMPRIFIEGYPIVSAHVPSKMEIAIDIGAASGRYALKFAQNFPHSTIYATDIVDNSLSIIKRMAIEMGLRNVVVQKEDVASLTFKDDFADFIYSGMVLQILPDVPAALREMHRVLKPGGTIIVSTVNFWNFHTLFKWYLRVFNRPKEYYGEEIARSPQELKDLFEKAGFEVKALDGFYPAYGIYRLKAYWKPARPIGKILNRLNRMIDPWTGRYFSRHFGFEIFVVATKKV